MDGLHRFTERHLTTEILASGQDLSSTPCCFSAGAQLLHPRRQYVVEGEGDSTVLRRALYSYYLLRCLCCGDVVRTRDGRAQDVGVYLYLGSGDPDLGVGHHDLGVGVEVLATSHAML